MFTFLFLFQEKTKKKKKEGTREEWFNILCARDTGERAWERAYPLEEIN